MSDISSPPISPLPEEGHDPTEPNDAELQDADAPSAPTGNPNFDVDGDDDNDSVLSDIDEAQFEDFDPAKVAIEERPVIDEDSLKVIGRHKRRRTEGADGETKKKKKEGRREKVKKPRKKRGSDDDDFSGGEEVEGKRRRKPKAMADGTEKRREKVRSKPTIEEDEEGMSPEEREFLTLPFS